MCHCNRRLLYPRIDFPGRPIFIALPPAASFPTFDEGVTFKGRALFVAGERSKFTNRDDEPLIR